jgi:PAS domain S-box-containing protein
MTTASPPIDGSALLLYRRNIALDEVSWSGSPRAVLGPFPTGGPDPEMPASLAAWLARIHPEDRDAARKAYADPGKPTTRLEYRLSLGPECWSLVRDDFAMFGDDVVVGAIRRANADIAEEAKPPDWDLIRFFELSLDLFCIANLDGFFLRVNVNFSRLLGYSEAEILARPFLDFIHPEDVAATQAEMTKLNFGASVVRFRNRYRDSRGEYHRLEWTARPIPEEEIIFAVARDVTDARLAEGQRIARVGSWEWRVGTDLVWWSDEQFRVLGAERSRDVPSFDFFLTRVHPDDRSLIRRRIRATIEDNAPHKFDYRIVLPDGTERIIATDAHLERDSFGKPYRLVGTCQDITERRREQEQRQALERKMQEAQKLESLGLLAGGIAHDFNNLLTAILGNASWIDSRLAKNSALRPSVDQILRASERAADMCRQMLAYSGRGRFILSIVDFNQLVREMAGLVRMSLSKSAELRLELSDEPLHLAADATQIRQVIMNLLINASEALGDHPGTIRVVSGSRHADAAFLGHCSPTMELAPGEYVVLDVVDTGTGMDAEMQRRIFDPFFTTKFTGRGLGLAAVLGIVRGHNGAIEVLSEPGKGSTFRLVLPLVSAEATNSEEMHGLSAPRGTGAVLIVEDEEEVRDVTARMATSLGYQVLEARDGDEAVERLRVAGDAIRVVLLDLTMPTRDGEETLSLLHALRPAVPVVLMSGFSEREIGSRFEGRGLAGFLAKPFTLETLAERLRTAIEGGPIASR